MSATINKKFKVAATAAIVILPILAVVFWSKAKWVHKELPIFGDTIMGDNGKKEFLSHTVSDIVLYNQHGKKITLDDFDSSILVVNIFFASCPTICPSLNKQVQSVAEGYINELLTKKKLQQIISQVHKICGMARTAQFLDDIKELGFQQAVHGGLSMGIGDVQIPAEKASLVKKAQDDVQAVWDNYLMGLITDNERYNAVIDIWTKVNSKITETLMKQMEEDNQGFNAIYMMMHSGARGSREQIRQLGGMRGLMAKPQKNLQGSIGEIIENPILSNFKEGLDVLEYFISTHGARKGLADTALKTADAGYLTRRLHDVAQDVIVNEEDCGTLRGIEVFPLKDNEEIIEPLSERILGRVSIHDVYDPITNELIVASGDEITEIVANKIDETAIESVEIRSVLTCETLSGVCAKCYGRNLATAAMVNLGEAVGVIASQSIGEPGTQLTLRTFHVGGTAQNVSLDASVKAKFDGVINFEEVRSVSSTDADGNPVEIMMGRSGEVQIVNPANKQVLISSNIPYG